METITYKLLIDGRDTNVALFCEDNICISADMDQTIFTNCDQEDMLLGWLYELNAQQGDSVAVAIMEDYADGDYLTWLHQISDAEIKSSFDITVISRVVS